MILLSLSSSAPYLETPHLSLHSIGCEHIPSYFAFSIVHVYLAPYPHRHSGTWWIIWIRNSKIFEKAGVIVQWRWVGWVMQFLELPVVIHHKGSLKCYLLIRQYDGWTSNLRLHNCLLLRFHVVFHITLHYTRRS